MKLKSEPWISNLSDPHGRYTLEAYRKLPGYLPFPHIPEALFGLSEPQVLHSSAVFVARADRLKWNDLPGDLPTNRWQRLRHPVSGLDVRKMTVLDDELRSRVRGLRGSHGPPRLGAGFDSSVPGLSIVGLAAAATCGPSMRFVFGSAFSARTVAPRLPR